jgi:hypothetical protein
VKLLDSLIDTMLALGVRTFLPQALSNAVWGCATLEHNHMGLVQVCRTPFEHSQIK